jgi:drug/metabolite transporter (DMT)-like permease
MIAPPADALRRLARRWEAVPGNLRGAIYMTGAALIGSAMLLFAKLLGTRLPANEVAFFRALVGLLAILPFVAAAGSRAMRTRHLKGHILRGVTGALGLVCYMYSAIHLTLAEATSYGFTRNLFLVVTAALFLGEALRRDRIIVTLVGFVGVLVMLRPDAGISLAALIGIAGAFMSSLSIVLVKKLMATEAPVTVLFYLGLTITLLTGMTLPISWVTPDGRELLMLAVIGVAATIGQSLIVRAYRAADATLVAPLDYLQLASSALLGLMVFGVLPEVWTWLGAAIIISANLFLTWREHRKGA